MEKYSCVAKSAASEESGWTSYFEEFSKTNSNSNYNREGKSSCFTLIPSSSSSSSLVSDAASACNFSPTKLTFKKTRTSTNKHIISSHQDDPLEDTASSPLNSPKVGELHPTEMTSRKIIEDQLDASSSPMDMGLINYSESEILDDNEVDEDKNVKGESERSRIECTELKKRGLCLVPLSMLVNYFG